MSSALRDGRVIDVQRLRSISQVAGGLLVAGLLFNFLLLALTGPLPECLAPFTVVSITPHYEHEARRIAGLSAQREAGRFADGSLLIVLGMSSANEGIDLDVLQQGDGWSGRHVMISALHAGFKRFRPLMEPLLRTRIRPGATLFCIHPNWLIGLPPMEKPESINPLSPLREGRWSEVGKRLGWSNWIVSNRFPIHRAMRALLHGARVRLGLFPPASDPWEPSPRLGYLQRLDAAKLREQDSEFEQMGWFDVQQYSRWQAEQAAALGEVIGGLRQLGSRVVIVVMPEQSTFRERIPDEARRFLFDQLEQAFGVPPADIWDLCDAIPDSMFWDAMHLNDEGRAEFSRQLADAIRLGIVEGADRPRE